MAFLPAAVFLVVLVAVVLPACRTGGPDGPEAVAPAAGSEELTVNRVLAGLDGVMGDLQRILAAERRMTPEVVDRLQAIYTGPELLNQIDAFQSDLARGLPGYRAVPGNRVTTVSRIVTSSPICIFAAVERDYSPATEGPAPDPASLYVVLVPEHDDDDPRQLNPTGWTMLYDGVQVDGSQPDDVCP